MQQPVQLSGRDRTGAGDADPVLLQLGRLGIGPQRILDRSRAAGQVRRGSGLQFGYQRQVPIEDHEAAVGDGQIVIELG